MVSDIINIPRRSWLQSLLHQVFLSGTKPRGPMCVYTRRSEPINGTIPAAASGQSGLNLNQI